MPPLTVLALAVAVLAVSFSGPLIAYAAAPALAIAFWRNTLATGVLTPFALARRGPELRAVLTGDKRRQGWYSLAAGAALALHFGTWMTSAQLTTVATSLALCCTQPVWAGLISVCQGRRLPASTWAGIVLAVAGAVWTTGADFRTSGTALLGDVLAVLGGMSAAAYVALGEHARTTLTTTTYTTVCYAACAAALLVVCLAGGVPLTGFPATTWLAVLAITVGAQLLGHSMFNYALHAVSATTISLITLLEVPTAALVAWLWLGQVPAASALPGMALLLSGVAVVVLAGARRPARERVAG
ncbi:drug/metabolite transporter (DMT)-like permease [Crossiella equi]|uniref:Drug/metabolite transporter (DMT)-like permease n=1 Tax=Crossiella equi TaxID=130796 RepID=A0ABS5AMA2_9PSEU|nr:DMT family transporter [Crossiella equi]MBP2477507.1 drug/metabolite transporter (DMT)-like permease [Crossiella equi]